MNFASNRLQLAQRLLNNRVPRRQIENLVQMSSKTISAIKNGTYRAGRRPGRSSFVSQSMLDFMETNWAADSTISDCSMRELVNETFGTTISTSTVWRCRQHLKFVYRPPKLFKIWHPSKRSFVSPSVSGFWKTRAISKTLFSPTKADFNADRIISGEGLREEFTQRAVSRKKWSSRKR